MTKQETLNKLKNLYDVVEQLPEDIDILYAQAYYETDFVHFYTESGADWADQTSDYGEYDDGRKCIKHSRCIDGVDVFFLEEETK